MSKPEKFMCEETFLREPEYIPLVESWSSALDEQAQSSQPIEDEIFIRNHRIEIASQAAGIIQANHPEVEANRKLQGLTINYAELWSIRAMLLASEIRKAAERVEPEEIA